MAGRTLPRQAAGSAAVMTAQSALAAVDGKSRIAGLALGYPAAVVAL